MDKYELRRAAQRKRSGVYITENGNMDRHRQPPSDPTKPARGVPDDSLARSTPTQPEEGRRSEPDRGVEREGVGPEEDLPERESISPEEGLSGRGNQSEETI